MPRALVAEPDGPGSRAPAPTGPDTEDDLCLGLELKFLLLGLPLSECRRDGWLLPKSALPARFYEEQAYAAVARVLERGRTPKTRSMSASAAAAAAAAPAPAVAAISQAAVAAAGRRERDYWRSHWIVKKAKSVEHTADDPRPDRWRTNGVAVPVELSSPMLAWGDSSSSSSSSSCRQKKDHNRQLRTVVARLRAALPVVANYTCDVHVHVGRRDGRAFALPTLKMLATLCWLAEPVLRSVRDPRSPNYGNAYTWGFEQRRYSRLGLALGGGPTPADGITIGEDLLRRARAVMDGDADGDDGDAADSDWTDYMGNLGTPPPPAVRAIWLAASAAELGLLLSGPQREHRRLGFNFSAFGGEDERARTNPRTVEVRFLEGTLAPERVVGWLRICGQLAALCTKGRRRLFRRVVRYLLAQQPAYDALRALRDVHGERGDVGDLPHPPRDVLFAELMERMGVQAATYGPFQAKIRREYRCA